jgi:hypothetical protein
MFNIKSNAKTHHFHFYLIKSHTFKTFLMNFDLEMNFIRRYQTWTKTKNPTSSRPELRTLSCRST